jgi:dehydratase
VNNISNLKMTIPTPANSTVVSATASGGTVAGTVATSGGNVVLTVPGPIAGGTSFTPPAVTVNVTAGAAGTPITSKYAGTSYTSPGMTMTTNVSFVGNVATSCYPNPSPTLTTTAVV